MSNIFISYAHEDEESLKMLKKHLSPLKNQGRIEIWYDRCISAGEDLDDLIQKNLEKADVFLLLISHHFIASDYCYGIELVQAMERYECGSVRVIPIILSPCDWKGLPFGKLLVVPKDGKPVTSWDNIDAAFLDVVENIKRAIELLPSEETIVSQSELAIGNEGIKTKEEVIVDKKTRSKNVTIRREITDQDKDDFLEKAFCYMVEYFENSLEALKEGSSNVSTRFKRIDANSFKAVAYKDGKMASQCKIMISDIWGRSITFSQDISPSINSCNDSLSVEIVEQELCLKALGGLIASSFPDLGRLSIEEGAEYYWERFMSCLQ